MNGGGHIQTTPSSLGGVLGDHLKTSLYIQKNQTSPELRHLEKKLMFSHFLKNPTPWEGGSRVLKGSALR